jgi:superfamily II DNA or RNA helicase
VIPPVLKTRYSKWAQLEAAIAALGTTKERGDAFEAFAYFYLKYFRVEQELLGEPEFPVITGRSFSKPIRDALVLDTRDYGIDGVFERVDNTLTAVQCKFRSDRLALSYRDLSTFWSEAHKAAYHLVFTNSTGITDVTRRREKHLGITVDQLLDLDETFFDGLYQFATAETGEVRTPTKKKPRPYQDRALDDILDGLAENDRGKLTAACGIGKTLIALWVAERRDDKRILFIAPNLQLIRQTLKEWAVEASTPFRFLAVCSDDDVGSELDEMQTSAADSDIRTTTDPRVIAGFLRGSSDDSRTIVFSTYQSLPRVVESLTALSDFSFDIAFFDEAHRTAGANLSTGFSIGLDSEQLRADKRLFMTATEKLFAPRAIEKAEDSGVVLFSMDRPELYGPTFHSLSFRKAIDDDIICDYEIVVAAVPEQAVREKLAESIWLRDEGDATEEPVESAAVVAALSISRAADQLSARKVVSYHASVRSARRLAEPPLTSYLTTRLHDHAYHVNGTMAPGLRAQVMSDFADADQALLTNARCLIEGVDIPAIDAVCFVTPKTSMIDIVQAVGRAVRKPWGVSSDKIARVLIPVIVTDADPEGLADDAFSGVFNVIQALREQDEALAQIVDEWNLRVSRGGRPTDGGGRLITWLTVESIGELNLSKLRETLELRIATVNARPGEHLAFVRPLGAGERASNVERLVRTMADYTPEKLEESLVSPTLARFTASDVVASADQLRIDNNNVSHARKLGVIRPLEGKAFTLTKAGRLLRDGERSFEDVMRNQLLLYEDAREEALFPYRLVAQFIAERDAIRYWDFLFGIYNAEPASPDDERIARAWDRVDSIERYYPALEVASPASKAVLVEELNSATGLALVDADIWTDRTTAGNQFRYFGRHLALFEEVFALPAVRPFWRRTIRLVSDGSKARLLDFLASSAEGLSQAYGDFFWWPLEDR